MAKNRTTKEASCYLSSLSTWYGNNCSSQRTLTQKKENRSDMPSLLYCLIIKEKRKRKNSWIMHATGRNQKMFVCVCRRIWYPSASVVEGEEDQLKHFGSENKNKFSLKKKNKKFSRRRRRRPCQWKRNAISFFFYSAAAATTLFFFFSSCKSMSFLWPLMLSHGLTVQRLYSKASFLCISWLYTHTLEKRETILSSFLYAHIYILSVLLFFTFG